MASKRPTADQIWPYLHGALNEEERVGFEDLMARDPQLAEEVKRARLLDELLCDAADSGPPLSGDALSESLAEDLHAEWEREASAGSLPDWVRAGTPMPRPVSVWARRFPRLVAVAAAAILLIAVSVYLVPRGPVGWQRPDYGQWPPPTRTMEQPVPPRVYSQVEFRSMAEDVEAATMAAYCRVLGVESSRNLRSVGRRWTLHVCFQELIKGDLSVRVEGRYVSRSDPAYEWELFVSSKDEFAQELPAFANGIAENMVKVEGKASTP